MPGGSGPVAQRILLRTPSARRARPGAHASTVHQPDPRAAAPREVVGAQRDGRTFAGRLGDLAIPEAPRLGDQGRTLTNDNVLHLETAFKSGGKLSMLRGGEYCLPDDSEEPCWIRAGEGEPPRRAREVRDREAGRVRPGSLPQRPRGRERRPRGPATMGAGRSVAGPWPRWRFARAPDVATGAGNPPQGMRIPIPGRSSSVASISG